MAPSFKTVPEKPLTDCKKCHNKAVLYELEDFYYVECGNIGCDNSTGNYYTQCEAEEAWNKENRRWRPKINLSLPLKKD